MTKRIILGTIVVIVLGLLSLLLLPTQKPSLIGEDKNNNGLWDDVEPFIDEHSKTIYHRKALEQYFKAMQLYLTHPELGIKYRNREIPDDTEKSTECIDKVQGKYGEIPDDLEDAIVNNVVRVRAYLRFNKNLSGGFYSLWDEKKQGNPCDFEVE